MLQGRQHVVVLGVILERGFAIVGVLYGLSITTQGGDLPDIVHHATLLPVLIATFILLLRTSKHISGNKEALEPSGQAVRPGS